MGQLKDSRILNRAMNLSLGFGILMLALKWWAYILTQSSVIFSDAVESIVHIVAVWFAWYALRVALKPPDADHHYGHQKIGHISAGVEGALICIAAIVIVISSVQRMITGVQLENLDVGIVITAMAGAANGLLGMHLVQTGKKARSLVVEANGKHVLTDAWTSIGAVIGLVLAWSTNILILDPLLAIVFAANIIREGGRLVFEAVTGLMDRTDPVLEGTIAAALQEFVKNNSLTYHRLRLRVSGTYVHVDFHLQFPDTMTIQRAHTLATEAESVVTNTVGHADVDVITHLEPTSHPDGHI